MEIDDFDYQYSTYIDSFFELISNLEIGELYFFQSQENKQHYFTCSTNTKEKINIVYLNSKNCFVYLGYDKKQQLSFFDCANKVQCYISTDFDEDQEGTRKAKQYGQILSYNFRFRYHGSVRTIELFPASGDTALICSYL